VCRQATGSPALGRAFDRALFGPPVEIRRDVAYLVDQIHDPEMFDLLRKLWGVGEARAAAPDGK